MPPTSLREMPPPPTFCVDPSDKKDSILCRSTFSNLYCENGDETTHIPKGDSDSASTSQESLV